MVASLEHMLLIVIKARKFQPALNRLGVYVLGSAKPSSERSKRVNEGVDRSDERDRSGAGITPGDLKRTAMMKILMWHVRITRCCGSGTVGFRDAINGLRPVVEPL